jgi:hypothetical protein
VTVDIGQVSGTTWAIRITDDTSGGSFETEPAFNGPGSTAEWIVEAPTYSELCGGQCPLAPYTDANGDEPGVTFSNLGLTGSVSDWYQITMVQNGNQVSTPSAYSTNGNGGATGFAVSYTGDSLLRTPGWRIDPPGVQGKMPKGKLPNPIFEGQY